MAVAEDLWGGQSHFSCALIGFAYINLENNVTLRKGNLWDQSPKLESMGNIED